MKSLAVRSRPVAGYASRALRVLPAPTPSAPVAQPFLKWVGGKGGLISQLEPLLPADWRRHPYFEPFLGGGAMFFHLGPRTGAVLGDTNRELVACYQTVRDDVEAVLAVLARLATAHDKDHFYRTRERWNAGEIGSRVDRAATFIYFNRTCFNGLWRVNRSGGYNVPLGSYANPGIFMPERLRAAAVALSKAHIRLGSYTHTVEDARAGDLVYFDPPYQPVSATANFTAYNAEAFGEAEQRKLAAVFALLDERGCRLMLSNSDTPLIKTLYGRFRIDHVMAARNVNSRSDRRGKIPEIVVRNY